MSNKLILIEYRCDCGKLLLKGIFLTGIIELKCKYCHKVSEVYGILSLLDNKKMFMIY